MRPADRRLSKRETAAAVAGLAFAAAAIVRRDAAIALLALAPIFIALESWFPLRPQPIARPGWATDAVHFLCDELIAAPAVLMLLALAVPAAHLLAGPLPSLLSHQPVSWRWTEALLIGEVAGYWGHRGQHQLPWLWRFHRLHHSSPVLDWLAPNRRHPVDLVCSRVAVAVPLLALGFPVPTLVAHFAIRRFQGLFVHANIRCDLPGLRWLIATPQFHHWHHADDPAVHNSNFAGELPLVDWLFGTLHLPDREWPESYGMGEDAPAGYLAQLAWPLAGTRSHGWRRIEFRGARSDEPAEAFSRQ